MPAVPSGHESPADCLAELAEGSAQRRSTQRKSLTKVNVDKRLELSNVAYAFPLPA